MTETPTPISMIKAINMVLDEKLATDNDIVIFGEDVGYFGGVFRATAGLQEKYGEHRVFDSPINEQGIVAIAIGMAANGLRPVIEIQFADYIFPAFDQIVSELTRITYRSDAGFKMPVTIRTPCGGGIFGGQTHSMSIESFFTHIPGLYVVMPSTPYDAKGLLTAAINCDDPVLFLEPKRIYNGPFFGNPHETSLPWAKFPQGNVPPTPYSIPLSQAKIISEGSDVTIITYGTMVHVTTAAIKLAKTKNINVELIDLRTIWPVDIETITNSVNKTGRAIIVHEAPKTSGFGAELSALISEHCFWSLVSPIQRVTGWDTPYPHAHEWAYFPSQQRILNAIEKTMLTD